MELETQTRPSSQRHTKIEGDSQTDHDSIQSKSQQAYDSIIDLILGNGLRLGERTSVNLLSSRLGIGRTPTKNAIIRLEAEGLLSVSERSGTTVNKVAPLQARKMFEVRHLIEDYCAEAATNLITPPQIADLFDLVGRMKKQSIEMHRGPSAEFVNANARFHSSIVAAAENEYLLKMYKQLQIPLQITSYLLYRRNDHLAAARRQAEHEAIAEALRARNGELLKQLLRAHTAESEDLIVNASAPAAASKNTDHPT